MHPEAALPVRSSQARRNLALAIAGAALLVLGARLATDALAGRPAAPPTPARADGTDLQAQQAAEAARLDAEARAARQKREAELIEQDRLTRERKRDEALRAREEALAVDQATKDAAWERYFRPAPRCANPRDDATRVDCSNQFMRARERFEKLYAEGKL